MAGRLTSKTIASPNESLEAASQAIHRRAALAFARLIGGHTTDNLDRLVDSSALFNRDNYAWPMLPRRKRSCLLALGSKCSHLRRCRKRWAGRTVAVECVQALDLYMPVQRFEILIRRRKGERVIRLDLSKRRNRRSVKQGSALAASAWSAMTSCT